MKTLVTFLLVCAFASVFAFAFSGTFTAVNYGDNKVAGHYLATRGIKLYYETYGQGEPLLMLHLNGESINAFRNNIGYFSKKYHVIAVDSRAHGKSIDTKDSLTFEQMADDFNALLDSLHLDSTYVIGWSDGGISGLLLAVRHPEKVKKLVVSGPNLWPDTTGIEPAVFHYLEFLSDSLKKAPATAANKNMLKVVNLDLLEPHISLEQLHGIKCPVMVMGGDHDAIPTSHLLQISQQIPQSYVWIVPNSSHPVAINRPVQFNTRINEFFIQPYRVIDGLDRLH